MHIPNHFLVLATLCMAAHGIAHTAAQEHDAEAPISRSKIRLANRSGIPLCVRVKVHSSGVTSTTLSQLPPGKRHHITALQSICQIAVLSQGYPSRRDPISKYSSRLPSGESIRHCQQGEGERVKLTIDTKQLPSEYERDYVITKNNDTGYLNIISR